LYLPEQKQIRTGYALGQSDISVSGIELRSSFCSGYVLSAVNPQICLQGCSHTARSSEAPLIPCSRSPVTARCHLHLRCKPTLDRTACFHLHSHPQLRSFPAAHSLPRAGCCRLSCIVGVASRGGIESFVHKAKFCHHVQQVHSVWVGRFFHCKIRSAKVQCRKWDGDRFSCC